MIGQPHKSPSIPPKVLWPVLIAVILGLGVGGFFILNSYIYNEKQGDNTNVTTNVNTPFISANGKWETYTNDDLGIQFSYPSELGEVNDELLRTDDIGTFFSLTFGDDKLFAIYGNSSDASPQRTQHFRDIRGYTQDDEGVYHLNGFDTTVKPTETLLINGEEVLIVQSDDFNGAWTGEEGVGEISYLPPPETGIGALLNAEGDISGYNFLATDLSLVSADLFKQILSTFKFTADATILDTSDWKTYTNEVYGFSLKYPSGYTKFVWTADNPKIGLLANWGMNKGQETVFSINVFSNKRECEERGSDKIFEQNGLFYCVQSQFVDLDETLSQTIIYHAILDSLQISDIDTANTTDWQTYTNDQYRFSFKYPRAWEFEYYKDYSESTKEGLIFGIRKTLYPEDENTQGFAQYSIKRSPSDGLEVEAWLKQNETWLSDTSGAFGIIEEKSVEFAGKISKYYNIAIYVAGGGSEIYYVPVGDSILTIAMQSRIKSGPEYVAEQRSIDQIFSAINDSISFDSVD